MKKNNLLVIGDVHGVDMWKQYVEEHYQPGMQIVFLGDYVDSFCVHPENIIKNMKEVFKFARENRDHVHLCVGNHDFHYMYPNNQRYSGFNYVYADTYKDIFDANKDLLDIAYVFDFGGVKYLCSHAGVTKDFLKEHDIELPELWNLWKENPFAFNHQPGSIFGDDTYQSPLWIRPRSLSENAVDGWTQIVGHTWHSFVADYPIKGDNWNNIWVVCSDEENNFAIF